MANTAASGTLVASTPATVTLNEARGSIRVVNRSGSADIWFTVASSGQTPAVPTVGGNDCYVAAAAAGETEEVLVGQPPVNVILISSATPTYTVESDHPSRH